MAPPRNVTWIEDHEAGGVWRRPHCPARLDGRFRVALTADVGRTGTLADRVAGRAQGRQRPSAGFGCHERPASMDPAKALFNEPALLLRDRISLTARNGRPVVDDLRGDLNGIAGDICRPRRGT